MGIFGKKKEVIKVALQHTDGLKGYGGAMVKLELDDINQCIVISPTIYKIASVNLHYENILNIASVSEKEIIEKNKSTVGRALAGGVVLGPLGAIVGGMSGIGSNKSNKVNYYTVINYEVDGETKVLSFKTIGMANWTGFIQSVKSRIKVTELESEIFI